VAERQILQDAIGVSLIDNATGSQTAAALGILGLKKVPFARVRAHDLAGRGYLKAFGNGFLCLNAFGTSHKCNNPSFSKGREI
jgi:hypothetical protein